MIGMIGTLMLWIMIGGSLTVLYQLCQCILITVTTISGMTLMILLSLMVVIVHYVDTSLLKLTTAYRFLLCSISQQRPFDDHTWQLWPVAVVEIKQYFV
jgi:hypothetical protein